MPIDLGNVIGPQGPKGDVGPQGPKGNTGATGPQGPKGNYWRPSVDSSGNLSWTDSSSTSTPASVNIKGPKGDIGATGPKGDTGSQGPQGEKGNTGSQGPTGATGNGIKSATITYQASTSGTTTPTGTWSSSIPSVSAGSYLWTRVILTYTSGSTNTFYSVGKMGNTGATGAQGPQGVQGPKGDPGEKGATGAQGPKGDTGPQGKGANNGTRLTNQNLNDYHTEAQCGWYYGGGGNTVLNKPSGIDAFGMWLLKVADGYYQQELHTANTNMNKVYIRTWQSSSWSAWVEKGKDGAQGPQGPKGDPGPQGPAATMDSSLSTTSTNGVQNKVVTAKINSLETKLKKAIFFK